MDSFHRELLEVLREMREIMASLDQDVQLATTVINDLVAALSSAGSGVSAADQTALETAIAAGQAAVTPTDTPPASVPSGSSDAQVPVVPEAPVSDPAVS
jgi:hypothetical protein